MTGMTLDIEERNDGAVFHLGGRVMFEADSQNFLQKLAEETEKGKRWIVVDASGVIAMSSTGLGILIAAHRQVVEKGGVFKLAAVSAKVKTILEITRLNTIFDIHENREDAVASIQGG